jgi:hypothetical protein
LDGAWLQLTPNRATLGDLRHGQLSSGRTPPRVGSLLSTTPISYARAGAADVPRIVTVLEGALYSSRPCPGTFLGPDLDGIGSLSCRRTVAEVLDGRSRSISLRMVVVARRSLRALPGG